MSSTRLSRYLNAPYQGVSQVPPQVALTDSCRVMTDCLPVVPHGIVKRPPMEWVTSLLTGIADDNALVHLVPRGIPQADLLLVLNTVGGSRLPHLYNYDTLSPVDLTVDPAAQTYLDTLPVLGPNRDIHALSVEDTTFLTNRNVVTAVGTDRTASRPFEGFLWIKTGGYGRFIQVTVTPVSGTPVVASIQLQPGDDAEDAFTIDTSYIAEALYHGATPLHSSVQSSTHLIDLTSQGYTVTWDGPVIYISHPTDDFTFDIKDGAGGTAVAGIKDVVQRFSDLPISAQDGFVARIANSEVGGDSDFYVQFQASGSTTTGTWAEVLAPHALLGLLPSTMPVRLFNHGTDAAPDWHLEPCPWGRRNVGDDTLSPDPGFVGDPIQALSWTLGRLTIVSTGDVLLSASDDPFKTYRSTLSTSLDSDPAGFLSPAPSKVFFKDAATFNEQLVVFANGAQCRLVTDTGALTDSKLTIFASSPYASQLPLRDCFGKIYYGAGGQEDESSLFGIYEFSLDRLSGIVAPKEMSVAIPTYLPTSLDRSAVYRQGYMALYGTSGMRRMVLHIFRYDNRPSIYSADTSIQNAFCEWYLPVEYTLMGTLCRGSKFTVFAEDAYGTCHVLRMDCAPGVLDPAPAACRQSLDFKVSSATLSAPTFDGSVTTFTLPFPSPLPPAVAVQAGNATYPEGYLPAYTYAGSTVRIPGDWRTVPLWFGFLYNAAWTPHVWYVPDTKGAPRKDGRFTVSRLKVDLAKFGVMQTAVTVDGRYPRYTTYEGLNLDDIQTPLDQVPVVLLAELSVPIGGRNIKTQVTFSTASHFGFQFMGYMWEGNYDIQASAL